ncbi:MAG: glycosyltransferase [Desulfobacteraceae bacterium]|nr:glycosyltransferase [Desulfobacteraceae bacterium]
MKIKSKDIIPCFSRSILQVDELPALPEECFSQGVQRILRIDSQDGQLNLRLNLGQQIPVKSFDCVLIGMAGRELSRIENLLEPLTGLLADYGQITILFTGHVQAPYQPEDLDQRLLPFKLMRYRHGVLSHGPDANTLWVLILVKTDYNPVAHARELSHNARPDCSIAIMDAIPMDLIPNTQTLARLSLEKQRFYFHWQQLRHEIEPVHALFSKARREFAQVTALNPHFPESYRLHADYWAYMGRPDMAARVLRSLDQSLPDPENKRRLQKLNGKISCSRDEHETAPMWEAKGRCPRILIITHDHSDYGMDTLYHGLCHLLGPENVVEFPWKPTLHGQNRQAAENYPCFFDFPGKVQSVASLVNELQLGKFDVIIYADVVQMAYTSEVRRLAGAASGLPIVCYDTWDDCYTPLHIVLKYFERDQFDLIFKREMLAGVDYGPITFPLPFGYPQGQHRPDFSQSRESNIFWAGKCEYGLRPVYIPALENQLGCSLDRLYNQTEYLEKLRKSGIGISFFGCGFDTVRYWELPANGVMLLAERPPIRIPFDFVDHESAVFFDDLAQLQETIRTYQANPKRISQIARAGYEHYRRYHTSVARARQMLGRMEQMGLLKSVPRSVAADQPWVAEPNGLPLSMVNEPKPSLNEPGNECLYLGLVKGNGYGWGVCSRYLIKELSRLRPVCVINEDDGSAFNSGLEGRLFQALTDINFAPMFEQAHGRKNYGYTFFENELTETSLENAKRFDLVLAGSAWCRDQMLEKGITHCDILIQGIDTRIFYPILKEKEQDRFVIFSGGKFELRKGQDLVLRAVKILQEKYPDVWLLNCWRNLWPGSVKLMSYSKDIRFEYKENEPWIQTMQRTYIQNGLDPDRIITYDLVAQEDQRELYAQTDIGLFPNRCEGGTNLVLMEYMACGKPVIASYTSGHRDILNSQNSLLLHNLEPLKITGASGQLIAQWSNPSLDEIVALLEKAYHHRDALKPLARQAGKDLKQFTWERSAHRLLEIID